MSDIVRFYGDWSNHDWTRGPMDIAAIAADGIEGGFHKFTDGLNYYVDPYFQTAINAMRNHLKFYGPYHVLWGNRSITGQADWLMQLLDQQCPWWRTDPRFRIMSDDEPFNYNGLPSIVQINQFHDYINSKRPILQLAYVPGWVYGTPTGLKYPAVQSNYGSNPAVHYPIGYPGNTSSRWASWNKSLQYGSQLIQGTQHTTDTNAVRDASFWASLTNSIQEEDMLYLSRSENTTVYLCNGMKSRPLHSPQTITDLLYMHDQGTITLAQGPNNGNVDWMDADPAHPRMIRLGWAEEVMGPVDETSTVTMTDEQITTLATEISLQVKAGASVDEIKTLLNGTKLAVS